MKNPLMHTIIAIAIFAALQAEAWTTTQDVANHMGATEIKEISFGKNLSSLTVEQKSEIRTALNEASKKGKIDEVKVLAWSDKEYPDKNGKQSKADVALAKSRIGYIENFLKKDLSVSSIDTYNMTERPNAIEKFFNTSDAKVKQTAELAGAAPTEGNTGVFDMKAQASKGVLLIFMKK